jgi:hypothetical protein
VRPRKRQRSTSSYSSSSSILSSSNNDSNYGDTSPVQQKSSSTSSYYSASQPGQTSKFDIDNIIMPFDMIASAARPVVSVKQVSVPTPMWRECPLETLINITDELEENLDDSYFIELHELCEKRKLDTARGRKLKASSTGLSGGELSASLPAGVLAECLSNGGNNGKKKTTEFEGETNPKLNSKFQSTKSSGKLYKLRIPTNTLVEREKFYLIIDASTETNSNNLIYVFFGMLSLYEADLALLKIKGTTLMF